MKKTVAIVLGILVPLAIALSCAPVRRSLVRVFSGGYEPMLDPAKGLGPKISGNDLERPKIDIALFKVTDIFVQPTDIQFFPSDPFLMVVLEKAGKARWYDLETKKDGVFFEVDVDDASEQGLLGLAFHPDFEKNGRFFINYTPAEGDPDRTRIEQWSLPPDADARVTSPKPDKTVLEVPQPYPNHNAGQLAFGPDGFLYVGFGDGGWKDDPDRNGQNASTLLGSMIRIDVNRTSSSAPYAIPPDNPFVGEPGHRKEMYAIGLRNPWRYSFDPKGRLIVADVGQNRFEEVTIVGPGENLGWNIKEATHCFEPEEGCSSEGLTDPIFEYGREDGGSVTGGYVVLDEDMTNLFGKYVFGDFLSGRLWALDLERRQAHTLGQWALLPSTFGRDAKGRVYVADFSSGTVLRIEEKVKP